jgi:hypothetical protein
MFTMLAPEGNYIDMTGATSISFKIRTHKEMQEVTFMVGTYDIMLDSVRAYYQTNITIDNSWTSLDIPLENLAQPSWVRGTQEKAFDKTKVMTFIWELHGQSNPWFNIKKGYTDTLDVDDIVIHGYTKGPPVPPILLSPENEAKDLTINPTLRWESSPCAKSYTLQVSTSPSFSSFVFNKSALTALSCSLSNLPKETTYYWRLNATNGFGTGAWSTIAHFTTQSKLPTIVTLKSPIRGDTISRKEVTLTWSAATPKVQRYIIQLSSDSSPIYAIIDSSLDTILLINTLKNNTRYWWNVSACSDGVCSQSDKESFFIFFPSAIPPAYECEVRLFTSCVSGKSISYSLARPCRAEIAIFDVKGCLLSKTHTKHRSAGKYSTPLPALTSGVYYLVFTAGDYHYRGKFVVAER